MSAQIPDMGAFSKNKWGKITQNLTKLGINLLNQAIF